MIKNFSGIATPQILIFERTDYSKLYSQASENKINHDIFGSAGADAGSSGVSKSIENLSNVIKIAKLIKSDFTKSYKSKNFVKANATRTNFLQSDTKKTFIYIQNAFIKALIL